MASHNRSTRIWITTLMHRVTLLLLALLTASAGVAAGTWDPPILLFSPPLAPQPNADATRFDRTLLAHLVVNICKVRPDGGCDFIDSLDANDTGDARLRLDGGKYMTVWKIPKWKPPSGGNVVQISVSAAGLELGSIRTPADQGSIPIKFTVYNDPIVRTRVLTAEGKSSVQIAAVLLAEFHLSAQRTAELLHGENFDSVQIATALRDVYHLDGASMAAIEHGLGLSSVDVGRALAQVYALDASASASILASLYTSTEVANALRDIYHLDASSAAAILAAHFSVVQVATALLESYAQDSSSTASILIEIGYSPTDAARGVSAAYGLDAAGTAAALKSACLSASDVYGALRTVFSLDFETGGAALVAGGYAPAEAMQATLEDLKAYYNPIIEDIGPVFRFHPDEKYLPSSFPWFLERAHLEDDLGNSFDVSIDTLLETSKAALNGVCVKKCTSTACGLVCVPDHCLGTDASETFLVADDLDGDGDDDKLRGDLSSATTYVHIVRQSTFTDLQFWIWYPYNGNGTIRVRGNENGTVVAPLGEHFSDWETAVLRLDNQTNELISVWMSAHGKYEEYPADDIEFQNGHVVVYASKNGHANFPHDGANTNELFTYDLVIPETKIDYCLPISPHCLDFGLFKICFCVDFTIPGFSVPDLMAVDGLNYCSDESSSLASSEHYEVVAAYDGALGAEAFSETSHGVLLPTEVNADGVSVVQHWIAFDGVGSPEVEHHLPNEVVGNIFFEQFQPLMSVLCGRSWKDVVFGIIACDEYTHDIESGLKHLCDPIPDDLGGNDCRHTVDNAVGGGCYINSVVDDFLLGVCEDILDGAGDQIPQNWLDKLAIAADQFEAARPDAPGARSCGFVNQAGDARTDKPQWIYQTEPNEDCPDD